MSLTFKYSIGFASFITIIILVFMPIGKNILFGNNDTDNLKARLDMVKYQIESRGIKDKTTLDAFRKVERHRFVPEEYKHQAYQDHPLPIGEGQTIS